MKQFFSCVALLCLCANVYADIYKYTDHNGVVTYTNVKPGSQQKSEVIIHGPATIQSVPERPTAKTGNASRSPADFPKVDQQLQQQRDSKRKDILLNELAQEKQALENAKQLYEEAQNTPEVYRTAQGKTYRNVAKYEEKLRVIEAEIQAHARNIELLNKELSQ